MKVNKPKSKSIDELGMELECKAYGIHPEVYRESQIIAEYYDISTGECKFIQPTKYIGGYYIGGEKGFGIMLDKNLI